MTPVIAGSINRTPTGSHRRCVMFMSLALVPLADRINVAFLFGSLVRGGERSSGDADVMVVGGCNIRRNCFSIRLCTGNGSPGNQ